MCAYIGPMGPSCHSGKNKTRPIFFLVGIITIKTCFLRGMRFIWMTLSNHDNVLLKMNKRRIFNNIFKVLDC